MPTALHLKTTVLPGGKIEVTDQALLTGDSVEVIILLPEHPKIKRQSAVDILARAPGQRLFKTAEDVRNYLQKEHEAWDH